MQSCKRPQMLPIILFKEADSYRDKGVMRGLIKQHRAGYIASDTEYCIRREDLSVVSP